MVRLKQNTTVRVLFIGLIPLLLTGCPHDIEDVQDITVINHSNRKVVFYKEYKNQTVLDTTLSSDNPWQSGVSDFNIIAPYSSREIREVKSNLEYVLDKGWCQYFLLDYDLSMAKL